MARKKGKRKAAHQVTTAELPPSDSQASPAPGPTTPLLGSRSNVQHTPPPLDHRAAQASYNARLARFRVTLQRRRGIPVDDNEPMDWDECDIISFGVVGLIGAVAFGFALVLLYYIWGMISVPAISTPISLSPFCQPARLPQPGEQPLPHPSDLLRNVHPIQIHSHKDYRQEVPLCTALHYGAIGVEADVWLQPDGELLVGHDRRTLHPEKTFKTLYVDPLVAILTAANARNGRGPSNMTHGIFETAPEQTLTLLIDIKNAGAKTFRRVLKHLEPLRAKGWLSSFEKGRSPEVWYGPITVVVTGNTPFEAVVANSTHRDVFFDAPLHQLDQREYDITNSYWASASIQDAIDDKLEGLTEVHKDAMEKQVEEAHRRGLKTRYLDLPTWPPKWKNPLWEIMFEQKVDLLNVDDLEAAAKWSDHS